VDRGEKGTEIESKRRWRGGGGGENTADESKKRGERGFSCGGKKESSGERDVEMRSSGQMTKRGEGRP